VVFVTLKSHPLSFSSHLGFEGAPVRGESIPIRLFLAGYDLSPTMRDINKKFSVKYYLNLVLVDEEERRYFKQQVRGFNWAILITVYRCLGLYFIMATCALAPTPKLKEIACSSDATNISIFVSVDV
jgi:hypothetical protein